MARDGQTPCNIHLAVCREPYLKFMMEGRKTVETRFAKRCCAPFERVADGDIVLLKRSAGKVVGVCIVKKVWFYKLDHGSLDSIRQLFGPAICAADETFWEDRKSAAVATLMLIEHVTPIQDVNIVKRDRRGWVVFSGQRGAHDR